MNKSTKTDLERQAPPGSRWRLHTGIGGDRGRLEPGRIGTVREFVPAEVPGAHNDKEDAVVLEFGGEGVSHAVSFSEAQLADWFDEVEK